MGDTGAAVDLERGEGEEKKTDSTDISHRNNSSAGSLAELSNVAIPLPAAREASLGGSGSKMQTDQRLEQLRDSTKEKYRDWKQRAEHNFLLRRIQLKTADFNEIRDNLAKVSLELELGRNSESNNFKINRFPKQGEACGAIKPNLHY